MTYQKMLQYKKAHVELLEIINNLSPEDKEKIPRKVLNKLKKDIDFDYKFIYDNTKQIFEQNLMDETKALLIQVYAKYIAPENETELWKKYNNICLDKIEKKRKEQYSPDNVFDNKSITRKECVEEMSLAQYKPYSSRTIWGKIKNFIKTILKIK